MTMFKKCFKEKRTLRFACLLLRTWRSLLFKINLIRQPNNFDQNSVKIYQVSRFRNPSPISDLIKKNVTCIDSYFFPTSPIGMCSGHFAVQHISPSRIVRHS